MAVRKFRAVYMRGGTSKGLMFKKEDLPADRADWDTIFLQAMGNPDPKQIDGMGGTVSSNNKVVVVWTSDKPNVDIEYLTVQVIVGKNQVDYKANCGNMTVAVAPFAVEEGMVPITEPVTKVRMLNVNTDKRIDTDVPIEGGTFAQDGDCEMAGIDGTAAGLRVDFRSPAGAKTGKLLPTGNIIDVLDIEGHGPVEVTILDVSNPLVIVRAADVGYTGTELPAEVDANAAGVSLLEKIRGTAAAMMGFARDWKDAETASPGAPKICFFTGPKDFVDIAGEAVSASDMDLNIRVISVFKCHKASPVTTATAVAAAACLEGSIIHKDLGSPAGDGVRIAQPSGVMTLYPTIREEAGSVDVEGVAVMRTARRIMEGTLFIRN